MLNWSTVPEEYLFDGIEKVGLNLQEANVQGIQMLIEPMAERPGYGRIVRLLSPDPRVYMQVCYQPGQEVCLFQNG